MGKILVVEDTELVRRVIQAYLNKLGHTADFAGNGQEAIDLFSRYDYDLVLLDCQLPTMDGIEVMRFIRQRCGRRIPVVALSASPSEARRCVEAGIDDFLSKPFTCEQLGGVLAKWIPAGGSRTTTSDFGSPRLDEGMREAALIALEEYKKDAGQRLERLVQAVKVLDLGEVARRAHAFRPLNAYLGAERMVFLLTAIEERAKQGNADSLPQLVEELLKEYERVKANLPEIERRLRR
jgi:CheY-like chemotaxis protein